MLHNLFTYLGLLIVVLFITACDSKKVMINLNLYLRPAVK